MTARIIDGTAIAKETRAQWKVRAVALATLGVRPGLAVVLVGDNPASRVYVRNKIKACGENGLHSELHEFPATVTEDEVLACIRALNADPGIHGILVQLPLPQQVSVLFAGTRILLPSGACPIRPGINGRWLITKASR